MTSYFFCCPQRLASGSIIEPGNWGRILRLYTPGLNANAWMLARELVFEGVRVSSYPTKPSRLDAAFVCPDLAGLRDFMQAQRRLFDLAYEVELLDPDASMHLGDWSLVDWVAADGLDHVRDRASKYWSTTPATKAELVTLSRLRIVARIP